VLFVLLEILLECILDIFSLRDFFIDDVEDIFEDQIHLTNRRSFDEVFDDFNLQLAHICFVR